MAGVSFGLMMTVALPMALFLWAVLRLRRGRALLLGIGCFVVFQMLLRIPLLQLVLPSFPEYLIFQVARPQLYLIFLALTAGLFEEVGRYLIIGRFMPGAELGEAAAFGLGHGGIESILLVGLSQLILIAQQGLPYAVTLSDGFIMAGLERLLTMAVHVSITILVWRSLGEKRPSLLLLSVLLHTLINALAVFMLYAGLNPWLIEAALAVFAAGLVGWTVFTLRDHLPRRNEP